MQEGMKHHISFVCVMVYPGCIPPHHHSLFAHTILIDTSHHWQICHWHCSFTNGLTTETAVWSLAANSLQPFITIAFWCCSPQRWKENEILSVMWIYHQSRCQLMSLKHLGLGAAWVQVGFFSCEVTKPSRRGKSTLKTVRQDSLLWIHICPYSVTKPHTFATVLLSFLRSSLIKRVQKSIFQKWNFTSLC